MHSLSATFLRLEGVVRGDVQRFRASEDVGDNTHSSDMVALERVVDYFVELGWISFLS